MHPEWLSEATEEKARPPEARPDHDDRLFLIGFLGNQFRLWFTICLLAWTYARYLQLKWSRSSLVLLSRPFIIRLPSHGVPPCALYVAMTCRYLSFRPIRCSLH